MEEDWIKTCIILNGCAVCGSEDITTRGFFVPYAFGGRYTVCNTIPLCDTCMHYWETSPNPFEKTSTLFRKTNKYKKVNPVQFAKTVNYLHSRILEVQHEKR